MFCLVATIYVYGKMKMCKNIIRDQTVASHVHVLKTPF